MASGYDSNGQIPLPHLGLVLGANQLPPGHGQLPTPQVTQNVPVSTNGIANNGSLGQQPAQQPAAQQPAVQPAAQQPAA